MSRYSGIHLHRRPNVSESGSSLEPESVCSQRVTNKNPFAFRKACLWVLIQISLGKEKASFPIVNTLKSDELSCSWNSPSRMNSIPANPLELYRSICHQTKSNNLKTWCRDIARTCKAFIHRFSASSSYQPRFHEAIDLLALRAQFEITVASMSASLLVRRSLCIYRASIEKAYLHWLHIPWKHRPDADPVDCVMFQPTVASC